MKLQITSFVFSASKGGKISCNIFVKIITISFLVLWAISNIIEKVWETKYNIRLHVIVSMLDINVDKKNTIAKAISNLKNVFISDQRIKWSISISLKNKTQRKSKDSIKSITIIVSEKPIIFHNINSYLFIGLLNIKNIVFPSTSLKSNWLHTNKTHKSQKISIIVNQKSTIILESSQIVSFHNNTENTIKIIAKNIIIYRYLFLIISLKVFIAIFHILIKIII